MIIHYLKIAWRNLMKYKVQNTVCIIGLAVGFVCFALSTLWISYEMTYDTSHRGADRLYMLYEPTSLSASGYSTGTIYPVSTLLKEQFPEVEAACAFYREQLPVGVQEGETVETHTLCADSCFMNLFGISVLSGSLDFLHAEDKAALTPDFAMRLFGTQDVLGKEIEIEEKIYTVCALVSGVGTHSSLSYGVWKGRDWTPYYENWSDCSLDVLIKLRSGETIASFQKKVAEYADRSSDKRAASSLDKLLFVSLPEYRYASFNEERGLELHYLVLFSAVGALVILSSLFNYLALFVSRMRMRGREIELRMACGSSRFRLYLLFAVEYLLLLLLVGLIGMVLIELLLPAFRKLSSVEGDVYAHALLYFIGLTLISMLCLIPFIRYKSVRHSGRRNLFRKVSVFFQLTIGILFVFCLTVLLKQVVYLHHTDIGWNRENLAVLSYVYPEEPFESIVKEIEQSPVVQESFKDHFLLLPFEDVVRIGLRVNEWDGKEEEDQPVDMQVFFEGEDFLRFYGIRLVQGRIPKQGENDKIVINETMVKALGMHEPLGKKVKGGVIGVRTIVGVVKDFHITPPTVPVSPMAFVGADGVSFSIGKMNNLAVRFQEGKWEELHQAVTRLMEKEYPDVKYGFVNIADEYGKYLESEYALLKLLVFVSVVCMLVSVFGIFSLVTLTCQQRRKEIAIRKINGATVRDILFIFAKEYLGLLTLSAVVAFMVGYAVMRYWLEQYVEQTVIDAWIYFLIYIGMGVIVCLSIGSRVWEAVRQNPAEVIKEMN